MKAVFVFCEGNHDVTFVARSLGQVAKATWLGQPIGLLPSPLGPVVDPANPNKPKLESLIAKRYSSRTLGGLKLQDAAHAQLPTFEAVVKANETLYVLIRCHGDSEAQGAMDLLNDVQILLNPAYGTDIEDVAAAFLFDADAAVSVRETTFADEYSSLLGGSTSPKHGTWVKGTVRVGLYVFHDRVQMKGTLEELLAPLVKAEWGARWTAADSYLTSYAQPNDPVNTKSAEWIKAQISVTGQFLFPGDPMTVVIGRGGLPDSHFTGAEPKALVSFLQGVPW
jgi:hypothetical protein